jgi:hypothetical protein
MVDTKDVDCVWMQHLLYHNVSEIFKRIEHIHSLALLSCATWPS